MNTRRRSVREGEPLIELALCSLSRASGVDFLEKALFVDALAEEVRFMLWDTGERNAERPIIRFFEHLPLTDPSLNDVLL